MEDGWRAPGTTLSRPRLHADDDDEMRDRFTGVCMLCWEAVLGIAFLFVSITIPLKLGEREKLTYVKDQSNWNGEMVRLS